MYANVVTLRYKNVQDVEKAVEKLKPLIDLLPSNAGFESFLLARTGEKETTNVVTFATEENALAARERMLPRVKEAVAPFLAGEPDARTSEILVSK